ncbi:Rieske (2Fe-2S) domain-containing protein [Mycobacteroides abscessus subsp. bolletii]|nr:Rieske (2Fe-2S) domain-containing protein [Mycobacteroides abscessus subsp. bolletii]
MKGQPVMTAIENPQNRVRVCAIEELTPGNITRVAVQPPVAVYNIDGEFYATADWCSHDKSSLADEGFIEDGQIECGWHFARFCIKSGRVTAPPATEPLATYVVEVSDGVVYLVLDN